MPSKPAPAEKPPVNSQREKVLQQLRDQLAAGQALLAELEDSSPAKMRRVKKLVASVPEGAVLLKLASKTKTRIGFSEKMPPGLLGSTKTVNLELGLAPDGLRVTGSPRYKITLDPLSTTQDAAVTLAHELRHLWQNTKLEKGRLVGTSPSLSVAFSRVVEGDARAFEAYFRQRLEEKLEGRPPAGYSTAKWKRSFTRYQKSSISSGYDKDVLVSTGKSLKGTKTTADAGKRRKFLSVIFNQSAAKALAGVEKVLVAGFTKSAEPYLTYTDESKLAAKLVAYTKPATREKLRKMEKTIRTGKG